MLVVILESVSSIISPEQFFIVDGDTKEEFEIVADREQEVSMETGSTNVFLLENEAHAYAAATTTIFLATSLSFDVPLLPPPSLILSLFCSVAL